MAMIINIGLFVKAKINLQNAVDAAAFSGAATQSRQLTDIAYLNWEMRNTYKEWMFKYYILGNYSLINKNSSGSATISYKMPSPPVIISTGSGADIYDIPSVCIHFDGTTNICTQYNVPGLPRFAANNFSGISDISETFLNVLQQTKAKNCSERSLLNFLTTAYWAYGMPSQDNRNFAADVPQIATQFPGAFPVGFELAVRIRNLEKNVNEAPLKSGVCFAPGNAPDGACAQSINNFTTDPGNNQKYERVVKAFYSAYRNLGNEFDNEMKESFTLTELPPSEVVSTDKLSFFPYEKSYSKFYLDLKLMPVNLATFYTAFVPNSKKTSGGSDIGSVDAGCDATKIALPIPAYPLGYYKDPNTLTYYAVKGQAKFVGLFNPFKSSSVTLTAYSAAKPFGGRIGPALYIAKNNSLYARTGSNRRTDPYAVSLQFDKATDIQGTAIGSRRFALGAPIPMQDFWVQTPGDPVGGVPDNLKVTYVMPNMVYDLGDGDHGVGTDYFQIYSPQKNSNTPPTIGLYNRGQVGPLRDLLGTGSVNPGVVNDAIHMVRRPTAYESKNWLIPSPYDFNLRNKMDAMGIVTGPADPKKNYTWSIYAPLAGPGLEFGTVADVIYGLDKYLENQRTSVDAYLDSLKEVAKGILASAPNGGTTSLTTYKDAANMIYNLDNASVPVDKTDLTCDSLAGKFYCYYLKQCTSGKSVCPRPFKDEVDENWSVRTGDFLNYYSGNFNYDFDSDTTPLSLFSAYSPGANQGADNNFNVPHPYLGKSELAKRNYYSAKFISVKSISKGAESNNSYTQNQSNFAIYSEGTSTPLGNDIDQSEFSNILDSSFTQEINSIKH